MKSLPLSLTSNLKRFFSLHSRCYSSKSLAFKREHQLYSCISISREDPGALAAALSLCEKTSTLFSGTQIHAYIVKFGFSSDIFTQNNLIKFYSKVCSLCDGFKVFDEMPQRNLVSWTLLINCAIQCEEVDFGLEMYLDMMRAGMMPNEFAIASVVKASSSNNYVGSEFGSSIHCFSMKIGMEKNPFVASSILTFYAKLGDIEAAESLFKSMDSVDTGCWNSMIGGFAQCGCGLEAMSAASLMQFRGITMDRFTFINALQGCSLAGDLRFGRQIHGVIITKEVGFNVAVLNSLIDMYFKMGEYDSGLKIFRSMHHRDIVTWNTVLGSFSRHENPKTIIGLFHDFMLSGLRPNHITISTLFRECGELCDTDLGLQFYCIALRLGLLSEAKVVPSLISMLTKCREMEMAVLIFESTVLKDIVIWNELIAGYNLNCRYVEAFKTFMNLLESGMEANEYTFSNVLDTYCRSKNLNLSREIHGIIVKFGFASCGYVLNSLIRSCVTSGLLDESFQLFHGFDQRLDIASWGNMISVLAHEGYYYQAFRFVNSLIETGERPDEFILGSILGCCAGHAAYLQTTSVHPFVVKLGYDRNGFVASALVDAYAKGGDIESARMVFDQSTKCNDVIMYNAMITAYAHHGCIKEALDIFDQLKLANLQPSHATFVSVISACGHMGLIDEGCFLFESMSLEYGMTPSPDNYGCLVDMFARNGFLEDAKRIIETMPYPPWAAVLRSLLSGSRIHGNKDVGEWAAKKLLQLDPENGAAHALLCNVYSEMGRWEDAVNVRREMTESGVIKEPGHSWTVSLGNSSFS